MIVGRATDRGVAEINETIADIQEMKDKFDVTRLLVSHQLFTHYYSLRYKMMTFVKELKTLTLVLLAIGSSLLTAPHCLLLLTAGSFRAAPFLRY